MNVLAASFLVGIFLVVTAGYSSKDNQHFNEQMDDSDTEGGKETRRLHDEQGIDTGNSNIHECITKRLLTPDGIKCRIKFFNERPQLLEAETLNDRECEEVIKIENCWRTIDKDCGFDSEAFAEEVADFANYLTKKGCRNKSLKKLLFLKSPSSSTSTSLSAGALQLTPLLIALPLSCLVVFMVCNFCS